MKISKVEYLKNVKNKKSLKDLWKESVKERVKAQQDKFKINNFRNSKFV